MGKNMKLIPLPFKHSKPPSFSSSSWPWPTCADPKAFSFRAENTTMNSIFVTEEHSEFIDSTIESISASESSRRHVLSTTEELNKEYLDSADAIENVIRGVKSERLFFEPSETSSSILGQPDKNKSITTSEDEHDLDSTRFVVIEMETMDPFLEFKESMKEMVEAHGVENLDGLEELLNCYLRVNGKCNHGYIIGAFVDLLVTHDDFDFIFSSSSSFSSTSQSTTCISQSPVSASSLSSFSTSNCKSTTAASAVSSSEDDDEEASA